MNIQPLFFNRCSARSVLPRYRKRRPADNVFSDDGTLAFVSRRGNRICVFDTPSLSETVNYIAIAALKRGAIEVSPLRDLTAQAINKREYLIESPRVDAKGMAISVGRVLPVEDFAKAAEGLMTERAAGKVEYVGCFVAGTLVHTAGGLVPIENIRVGTLVLSQPEDGGARGLRRVINKVAHLDQPVIAVQIEVDRQGHDAVELSALFATPNHPFWVETPLIDDKHWLAAERLEPGMVLQLADGRRAQVRAAGAVRRTQYGDIFFAENERVGHGQVMCLSGGQLQVADAKRVATLDKLTLGEAYLTPVYNFEVADLHLYYVGEVGVWVHSSNCPKPVTADTVVDFALRKSERDAPRRECFPHDTYVISESMQWIEIDRLSVGSLVLSRCERTGQTAFKRISKKYEHLREDSTEPPFLLYQVSYLTPSGEESAVEATAEHPFWVVGEGWVNARNLRSGQLLEVCDPVGDMDSSRPHGEKMRDFALSGMRWHAKIISVNQARDTGIVYNMEVQDFHTYFVGYHGIWVHSNCPGEHF